MQEFLVFDGARVVLPADELGVGDRGERAEAQVDAVDERHQEADEKRDECRQHEQRPPSSDCLTSHADHSMPTFSSSSSPHTTVGQCHVPVHLQSLQTITEPLYSYDSNIVIFCQTFAFVSC